MSLHKIFSDRNTIIFSILVLLVFLCYRVVLIFYHTPNLGGVEVNIIYFVQRLLDGQTFYTDPEQSPYAIAQYSPLYYYAAAGIARMAEVKADDVFSLFIVSRSISLFFNLAFLIIVYLLARNIFSIPVKGSLLSALFAFIFLESTSFARPDSLHHFFFLLAIYLFMKDMEEQRKGNSKANWLFLSAVVSVIALLSKQTAIVLPLVFAASMVVNKQSRRLLLPGLVYIISIVLFLLVVHYTSGTELFYKNAILGINNGISPGWFRDVLFYSFYIKMGLLLVPAFIITLFFLKRETLPFLRHWKIILILVFILMNGLALKFGSNIGYLTEWWTLLFITIVYYRVFFYKMFLVAGRKALTILVWFVLTIKLLLVLEWLREAVDAGSFQKATVQYNDEKALAQKILRGLQPGDKYVVLTNFHTSDSYLSNFLFRHAAAPQMDIIHLAAYPQKKYNYDGFRYALQNGHFKWMLMRPTLPQKQFFTLRLDNYELKETTAGFNLYYYTP